MIDKLKKDIEAQFKYNKKLMIDMQSILTHFKHDDHKTRIEIQSDNAVELNKKILDLDDEEIDDAKKDPFVEQRRVVTAMTDLVKDIISHAIRNKRPLLATAQTIQEVFQKFKEQAINE